MKVRVGLVGLGEGWEERHLPALRALADRFEVRAVCDQVGHRAQLAAALFAAQTVDGFHALAAREDVDALLLLAPQWYGPLPILAACRHRKAVYCAQGVCFEPDQAEAIRKCVETSGVVFMAELPRRHSSATLRLKELIATRLGPPRLVFCHHRMPSGNARSHPAGSAAELAILHEMVELVDWCRYVVGKEAHGVSGVLHGAGDPSEADYLMMTLDFSEEGSAPGTGPIAQISCGRYIPRGWHEAIAYRPLAGLQVCCEHGIAFVDLPSTVVWFDDAGRHQESLESERPASERLLAQFHRAIGGSGRKASDLEDACRAIEIVQQAERSFRQGRRMAL